MLGAGVRLPSVTKWNVVPPAIGGGSRTTPRIVSHSDDQVVVQALVAAGIGVTTVPGVALQAHRRPGIHTTELTGFRRRSYAATYGDPPDQPAVAAVLAALTGSSPGT